jgi:hypothetical protein
MTARIASAVAAAVSVVSSVKASAVVGMTGITAGPPPPAKIVVVMMMLMSVDVNVRPPDAPVIRGPISGAVIVIVIAPIPRRSAVIADALATRQHCNHQKA